MKSLTLLALFIIIPFVSFCQTVRGRVMEKGTNAPICFATVYFNGTFVGTSSDQNGNFELNASGNSSMPITVSAIGYYSVTITDYLKTDSLKIHLHPKTYELGDATIKAKSLERKRRRYLRIFREEFIGTTANAQQCKILNEGDITFNYDSDADTLKAYALKPIVIENRALGYRINYYLDKFEYYKKDGATFFCGNLKFDEELSGDETLKQFYRSKREFAYLGSRMHFFRVLWAGKLESSGFKVRNSSLEVLIIDDVLCQDDRGNKFLSYPNKLLLEYHHRRSIVEFIEEPVFFDESGFYNPGLKWSGIMGLQRIADWLPYEYVLER